MNKLINLYNNLMNSLQNYLYDFESILTVLAINSDWTWEYDNQNFSSSFMSCIVDKICNQGLWQTWIKYVLHLISFVYVKWLGVTRFRNIFIIHVMFDWIGHEFFYWLFDSDSEYSKNCVILCLFNSSLMWIYIPIIW